MKKTTCLLAMIVVLSFQAYSQNQVDALRFSQNIYGGTARSVAMGGAFGALGADFSTLSMNPAGIGLYKSSEITFSPSIYVGKTNSTYAGQSADDIKYNFNFSNAGIVFAIIPKKPESVWKGIQLGIGVNRIANFNNSILIEGPNSQNSIVDNYLADATGVEPSALYQFGSELAFNTYLLDTLGGLTNYISAIPNGGTLQQKYIEIHGSINELVVTIGGNYNDKLYIGGTFGFPYLRYYENSTYKETDTEDTIVGFNSMSLHEDIESEGTGFNFKLGLIYRITDWVRIGAAVHTPTFYNMKDKYSREMTANYDNGVEYNAESPKGSFDYELNTPLKAIGSIAFVIGKHALISADYEFIDYSNARLHSKTYEFFEANEAIGKAYKGTSNIRAGFELKFDPVCIRGGYQLSFSPYKNDYNDGQRMAFSGGIGLRDKSYFIDLGYMYQAKSEDYYLYSNVPSAAVNDFSSHNIILTLGCKF
jgi:long-subunit fatty acid transport protein